jgi:putative spermidine/putrescine transport system substrate-binding protein
MQPFSRRTLLGGAGGLALAPTLARPARAAGQVVVGAWGGDYAALLDSNIDKPIMTPLGIEVLQDIANQEPRKTKLTVERNSRRGSMDVACLSDIDTYSMSLLNIWEPITVENVPNLAHVPPAIRTPYSVPHIISGKVMLYNPSKIPTPPKGFADMWDPKYKGRVGLVDIQYLYVIALATLAKGGGMSDFTLGKQALLDLKKLEPKIYPSNEALAAALKSEEVWLGPMWLARGVFWRKSGINVQAAVPSEGAIAYISSGAVPKNAPNKANGLAYLNAMLDPRAQVGFAKNMSYAPTVDNAPVDPALMKDIGFTPEQQANMKNPDFDYFAKNTAQLLDFWNREFKAA